jgi:hypothetical protein
MRPQKLLRVLAPTLSALPTTTERRCGIILNKNLDGDPFDGMRARLVIVRHFKDAKKPPTNPPRVSVSVMKIEGVLSKPTP